MLKATAENHIVQYYFYVCLKILYSERIFCFRQSICQNCTDPYFAHMPPVLVPVKRGKGRQLFLPRRVCHTFYPIICDDKPADELINRTKHSVMMCIWLAGCKKCFSHFLQSGGCEGPNVQFTKTKLKI